MNDAVISGRCLHVYMHLSKEEAGLSAPYEELELEEEDDE